MRLINRHPDRSSRLLLILLPFALLLFVYFSASTSRLGSKQAGNSPSEKIRYQLKRVLQKNALILA